MQSLKNQLRLLKNVTFHGTIEDSEALSQLAQSARVGLALYDPSYAMFAFNDPLKIKDYLSAGLRVVSTLPTSVDDGVILKTSYSVDSIVPAIVTALTEAPAFPPNTHKILHDGEKALTTLVEQITTEEN